MLLIRTIRWKALLMLTVFAANFMVVCHCSARAQTHTCCEKKETRAPCKDDHGCSGMHAVKFNLSEKKASSHIALDPVYAVVFTRGEWVLREDVRVNRVFSDRASYNGSPPDLQSLYQCFRI